MGVGWGRVEDIGFGLAWRFLGTIRLQEKNVCVLRCTAMHGVHQSARASCIFSLGQLLCGCEWLLGAAGPSPKTIRSELKESALDLSPDLYE